MLSLILLAIREKRMIKILHLNDKDTDIRPGCSCVYMCLNKFYLFDAANAKAKINREEQAFYSPKIQKN
jgi:hypothetical protein